MREVIRPEIAEPADKKDIREEPTNPNSEIINKYVAENGPKGFENFNFDEFLFAQGIPHDNEDSGREEMSEKYSARALESLDSFLSGLPREGRHLLNLKDFEYLRPDIYGRMKDWLGEEESGQLVVAKNMLGRGGFGEVFEADMLRIAEKSKEMEMSDVVVKKIPVERSASVLEGLKNALNIDSDNVMKVHEIEKADDSVFVYMERVEGQVMKLEMPLHEFTGALCDAARGVEAINNAGFAHRDVKGPNILCKKEGADIKAKVIDLDLLMDEATLEKTVKNGQVCGTFSYMPPEGLEELAKLRKIYLRAIDGNESSGMVIQSIMQAKVEGLQLIILSAQRGIFKRFEEIRRTAESDEEAKKIINGLDLGIDVRKYDVYALGVMLKQRLKDGLMSGGGEVQFIKKLTELAEEMTRPLPSERIGINEAVLKLAELYSLNKPEEIIEIQDEDMMETQDFKTEKEEAIELQDEDIIRVDEEAEERISKIRKDLTR